MSSDEKKTFEVPGIHFSEEVSEYEKDGELHEIQRIQLLKKGESLVTVSPTHSGGEAQEAPEMKCELTAGENTSLSDDGKVLVADTTGYPTVTMQQQGNIITVKGEIAPLITVSSDKMKATMTIYPQIQGLPQHTLEDIERELVGAEIRFGIDRNQVRKCLQKLKHPHQNKISDCIVARGMLAIDGENSYMRYEKEIGPLPGTILLDGSIDFRDRKMFVGVSEGELIAKKIPATKGTLGMNVLGKELPAREGQDIVVKVSDDAEYIEETGEVIALKAGVLTVVNNNDIKVCSQQQISSDIDFATGNIESHHSVVIGGSILPSFKVKARGDVLVKKNIQDGVVSSRSNIIVTGGIIGKKSRVRAKGDIDIGFIESGKLASRGTIIVRRQAYYSRLSAVGDIFCHKESKVVGGIIACSGSFTGGTIGTPQSEPAVIAVGVDRKKYKYYRKIKRKLRVLEDKKYSIIHRLGVKNKKIDKVAKKIHQLEKELAELNLETKNYKNYTLSIGNNNPAEIVIHGHIFRGTQLRIGNLKKILEENVSEAKFVKDISLNEIKIIPLD